MLANLDIYIPASLAVSLVLMINIITATVACTSQRCRHRRRCPAAAPGWISAESPLSQRPDVCPAVGELVQAQLIQVGPSVDAGLMEIIKQDSVQG